MIIPMLCVTIFVILVVWFLLPRVARLMIHTPTAISIFRSEERFSRNAETDLVCRLHLFLPSFPTRRSSDLMQCDRLMLMVGLSFLTLSRWLTTDQRRFMIIPMLCVTIFVILVVWF